MVLECNFQGKSFFSHATCKFYFIFVALCELLNQDNKLQLIVLVFFHFQNLAFFFTVATSETTTMNVRTSSWFFSHSSYFQNQYNELCSSS
jgi:hypothetical protein